MRESKRAKERLRLVNLQISEEEREEANFQERIETFWKRFQKMSSSEKREEVRRLFSTFEKNQKRIETFVFQWKNLFQKDRETRRKLRVIGERMRGKRKG
ncbi:hypothetical protein [Leptospira adleri]|uniref:hypothetical protein n=1 Tax=Leptospira adleri TaxID=2023186 RepID=UPI00108475CA|nr:hypothetical protein [Leptospira adleri]TGM60633.1 hypothetical protein EHQ97_02715 [Leptospira adleri]